MTTDTLPAPVPPPSMPTASGTVAHPISDIPSPSGLGKELGTIGLALIFVLALAWVMLLALKHLQLRRSPAAASGAPQVLHTVNVGAHERLVTLRYQGRDYLIGVTPASITLIDRSEDQTPSPAPEKIHSS